MENGGINVLSLFDGMSCGQLALERVNVKVRNYLASEIEPNAIKVTLKNYHNTKQIGDVTKLKGKKLNKLKGKIDLLIGGSPCQDLSIIVVNHKGRKRGLKGKKSKLFYEYVRVLKEIQPKYFLLENVGSMKNSDKDIITQILGVEPIMINSNLVSAQDRERYYWTNIPGVKQPKDKGLLLKDIVQATEEVDDKYWYKDLDYTFHGNNKRPVATLNMNTTYDMMKRVYGLHQKAPTLTTVSGGHLQKKILQDGTCRRLTPLEYERLQTVPDNYTDCVADGHRYNILGNGWTIDVIAHIFKYMKRDMIKNANN